MPQPPQDWSHEHQRWLQTHWDATNQRWFRMHYVQGQGWVFFDWLPVAIPVQTPVPTPSHTRIDSAHSGSGSATGAQAGSAGFPTRGQGQSLYGTYDFTNPQPDSHYERLDPSFCVRSKDFFVLGRVFSVLFTEGAGETVTSYNDTISYVKFGEQAHTQIRRFIVVRQKKAFCFAIPIFTYGNQGTKKPGVEPDEHAIAYSLGNYARLLPGEAALKKDPICIVMNEGEKPLSDSSRIFFGIHHPIQYNVKVKDLGLVHQNCLVNLKGYWTMENKEATNQDANVTADGAREGGNG